MSTSDFPRRSHMQQWCEAEHKIRDAMLAVENMGADIRLTDAVCLLGAARDRVADFVDGVEGKRTFARVAPAPAPEPRWRERLIARLMEALRPFARWSFEWPNTQDEITVAGHAMVTVGDLRRAQAALDHASQVAREDRGARVAERPAPEPRS